MLPQPDLLEPGPSLEGLRVLHVVDNLKLGGTQALGLRMLTWLSQAGCQVKLCVLSRSPRDHQWPWLPNVTDLDFSGDYRVPFALSRCAGKFRKVVDDFQPDLIHSYLWTSDVVAALSNRGAQLPHVVHIVDRRSWQASRAIKARIRQWMTRRAFARSQPRFLAVSAAAGDFAMEHLRLDPDRVGVAYNSIDVEDYDGVGPSAWIEKSDRPLTLGIASRIEPEKGHAILLDALSRVADRGNIRLWIAGEGSSRPMLEHQVQRLGLSEVVQFIGWAESFQKFMGEIDVFVVPSVDSEGLPTTILEAMASRRLVIATDVGGAREAIRNRVDGLMVPPGSAPEFAAAIEAVVNDRPAVRRMIESARTRVARDFSTTKMMQTVVESYRAAIAERQPMGVAP